MIQKKGILVYVLLMCILSVPVIAQIHEAPASISAALLAKLMAFEKNMAGSEKISIFVLNSDAVFSEIKKTEGKAIGGSQIGTVSGGAELPEQIPHVLFVGDAASVESATAYSRQNKCLTVTNKPELVSDGITLGLGVGEDGKPKILLNLSSSVEENRDWNPAIMKVARIIK